MFTRDHGNAVASDDPGWEKVDDPAAVRMSLGTLLRSRTAISNERWRGWCEQLIQSDQLTPATLRGWWQAIVEFDEVLTGFVADPVVAPANTVLVAGSGKEVFKTFNVSTAAALLAAAAGTPVVKGVSRSVSAISGAADILDVLGIRPTIRPAQIPRMLERHGIAFVPYPVFCPRYAARYDGVFDSINPASFFMPIAALCVRASGFVLGLANPRVMLAARALNLVRPDLSGVVVVTDLSHGEFVDEYCDVGTVTLAYGVGASVEHATSANVAPDEKWRHAVAHRATHEQNAAIVAESLVGGSDTPCARLVEHNAALIASASVPGRSRAEALDLVRHARRSGSAANLLRCLTTR